MDSKFMNLKKEYKDFIKLTGNKIRELNINNELTKKKCTQINELFENISHDIEQSDNININYLNHIILNYSRENEDVEILKKFIKIKNYYLIKNILSSQQWEPFIEKLYDKIIINDLKIDKEKMEHREQSRVIKANNVSEHKNELKLNKKKYKHFVAKGVYRLLLSTLDKFKGCWEIAEFKDDKLKKLEIVEPEHFEFIKEYIIKKTLK